MDYLLNQKFKNKTKQNKSQKNQNQKTKTLLGEYWRDSSENLVNGHGNRNGKDEGFLQSPQRKTQLDLVVALREGQAVKDEWVHGIKPG